jgi:hypothetical protein
MLLWKVSEKDIITILILFVFWLRANSGGTRITGYYCYTTKVYIHIRIFHLLFWNHVFPCVLYDFVRYSGTCTFTFTFYMYYIHFFSKYIRKVSEKDIITILILFVFWLTNQKAVGKMSIVQNWWYLLLSTIQCTLVYCDICDL